MGQAKEFTPTKFFVKLTKVTDDKFGGIHPNGINAGYEKQGYSYSRPAVGRSFYVGNLGTSTVIEVVDDNTFKTENSTYRWEILQTV